MIHPIIAHVEIPVKDLKTSNDFYKALFNWEFKPFGNGYMLFNSHKGITVGLRQASDIASGESTIFHINVENIDDITAAVEKAGGKIVRQKTIIPVMGWYALISDINGNTIGLYQSR